MPDNFFQLFAAPIITAIAAVIVVVIQARRAKQADAGTLTVGKQEADTHEFDALTRGFVAQLAEVRIQMDDQKDQINDQKTKIAELTARVVTLEEQKQELLEHVSTLEKLIPNPPGAPKRPGWNPVTA